MFTNSEEGQPEAAWFNVNNAQNDGQRIRDLVAAGYMVRTRADEETKQARRRLVLAESSLCKRRPVRQHGLCGSEPRLRYRLLRRVA
jgi:hypothetical protein